MNLDEEISTNTQVLATEIKHLNNEMREVKDEIKGMRLDFSSYLDKEAERWQKWGELKTDIVGLTQRLSFLEKVVYGACGFILLSVLGAIVYLVIK